VRIIVPIKQVPETSNVKMDPKTGTIVRAGAEAIINPLDLYAIEAALRLRDGRGGGRVDVVSMGPSRAERAIREAISIGCDGGYLVSDRKFGGADTWATSYVLSRAIASIGPFDLIITGERATDGDTAQVGPGIASWLKIPVATYVANIRSVRDEPPAAILVERLIEDGYQSVEMRLPALMSVVKEIAVPRLPTLQGKKRAIGAEIPTLNRSNLELEQAYIGISGSPTKVVRIRSPKVTRGGHVVHAGDDVVAAVTQLVEFLEKRDLLRVIDR